MNFTVREFEDLLTIIEEQPEWRSRLQKALFPDIDIAKALQDLAETAKSLRDLVERVDARLVRVERDVRTLKGDSLERKYRDSATGIFGLFIKNGHDVTNEIANQLYAAVEAGTISENDLTQVLAADLLWGGENRKTKEAIVLVMEASWLVGKNDVERAARRSAILRKIGLRALAVVGGKEWSELAQEQAEQAHVVMTTDGRVERHSWDLAMQI